MSKFINILEACKCGKSEKDCCKGKCKGKCSCKKVEEAIAEKCPTCGLDIAKTATDFIGKGKKKCACKKNEAIDSEEAGDAKLNAKKEDKKDKPCPSCGATSGYVKSGTGVKCQSCGKLIKESKFEKYLEEEILEENIEVAELLGDKFKSFQAEVVQALGKGLPKSVPKSSIEALIKDAQAKELPQLVKKLSYLLDK